MTENEKWTAVVQCDTRYDGQFFYGVKTTGVFCRPSCNSKTPLRENVMFFSSAQDAMEQGFRPCKRCRPDLLEYQPVQELTKKAKNIYDTCFTDETALREKIKEIHIVNHHLVRLFHKQYGITPNEYISKLRIENAKKLLISKKTIIEIAHDSGFRSLTAFYENFKRVTGTTPTEYRKQTKRVD